MTKNTGKSTGAAVEAAKILEDAESAPATVAELGEHMATGSANRATKAARVLAEIGKTDIQLLVPLVPGLARGITSKHRRVVQTSATSLPLIARVAPARVAKQIDVLKESYTPASATGKDGLVRTFSALCTASVAYQQRLEPVLTQALDEADGKTLLVWSQVVLPALKGEPHARARAVVERRMYQIPRSIGQKIAENLGVRLRHSYRA